MNKWLDEQDWHNTPEDDDDEIIWVSKSEIKRDAEALKKLGNELVDLGSSALAQIPLDDELREAINLAQRIKREARRRQLQLIGKMLRQRDVDPLYEALDKLNNKHNQQNALFHRLEKWRDRLLEQGDSAISDLLIDYPNGDRQQLRTLVRGALKEKESNKPAKIYRQLFQYLKQLSEA